MDAGRELVAEAATGEAVTAATKCARAKRREAIREALRETQASRTPYAAKVWEREHGRAPRADAYSVARRKP